LIREKKEGVILATAIHSCGNLRLRGSFAFFPATRYTHLYSKHMTKHLIPIVRSLPDLLRLAEEVKETKTPRVLKKADETVAILIPFGAATKPKKKRGKTQADYEAFLSAAGSWNDVDIEKFKNDIFESRRLGSRPPVEL
jgi:hypothetical protein